MNTVNGSSLLSLEKLTARLMPVAIKENTIEDIFRQEIVVCLFILKYCLKVSVFIGFQVAHQSINNSEN